MRSGCSIIIRKDLKHSGRKNLQRTTKKCVCLYDNHFLHFSFVYHFCMYIEDNFQMSYAHTLQSYKTHRLQLFLFFCSTNKKISCKVTFKPEKKHCIQSNKNFLKGKKILKNSCIAFHAK